MKKISSSQNPLVKKLVQLSNKQSFRNKQGLTIIEGVHLVSEWLKTFGSPEICVVSSSSKSFEVEQVIRKCEELGVEIVVIEPNIYTKISPVIEGVGILFVVKISTFQDVDFQKDTIFLEKIQDPGNLGTMQLVLALNKLFARKGLFRLGLQRCCDLEWGRILN